MRTEQRRGAGGGGRGLVGVVVLPGLCDMGVLLFRKNPSPKIPTPVTIF